MLSINRGVTVPDTIDDARRLIQSRLDELDTEAKQLERALASLGEGSGPPRRRPRRPSRSAAVSTRPKPTPAPRRRRSKRAARGQRREQLLAAIKATPGARPSELARSIGIRSTQVHALIAKARAEKLIVKKGAGYVVKA
jgi:hypothetical protein